jgi:hypothetical protein
MNQGTAIILWRDNVGYVLEKHHTLVVDSPTKIRLGENSYLECSAIEYLNNPNIKWESQHFLELLIPWSTKIGYYKDKFLVSVPVEAIDSLHKSMHDDVAYNEVLYILKKLKNNPLLDVSRSSFELKFHDIAISTPLNTFIKILGPSDISHLRKLHVFGLTFLEWNDHWIPLIEAITPETKYISLAHHTKGLWALPLTAAPRLVQTPAELNDVLSHIVDLLRT